MLTPIIDSVPIWIDSLPYYRNHFWLIIPVNENAPEDVIVQIDFKGTRKTRHSDDQTAALEGSDNCAISFPELRVIWLGDLSHHRTISVTRRGRWNLTKVLNDVIF